MKIFKQVSGGVAVLSLVLGITGPVTVFAAGPATVNLGSAGNFVILAKTGISTTGNTSIVGDLGISPAAASYLTGFALTLPAASAFSTSALVTGKLYAPGYADPTPANLTTAVLDMQTAYTDAAGRTLPTATELGTGNIGGLTIAPGLYKWGTSVTIPTDVTLSGGANDIWIFQIAQNLNISPATKVVLAGGAQSANVFWQVAGQTTLGTTAVFNGNILDQTAIVLNTGATLNGRALAQTAVTLDSNAVTKPALASGGTPTPSPSVMPSVTPTPSATPTPASQQLFRQINDAKVYLLQNGQLQWIKTLQDFTNAGYSWSNIQVVTPAQLTQAGTITFKVNAKALNVRDQGSMNGKIISKVYLGNTVQVVTTKKGWSQIMLSSGQTGWAYSAYLVQ